MVALSWMLILIMRKIVNAYLAIGPCSVSAVVVKPTGLQCSQAGEETKSVYWLLAYMARRSEQAEWVE